MRLVHRFRTERSWQAFAALALAMLLTRHGHFGELSRLPDASWAVFFLGGAALRDWRAFAVLWVAAWVIDLGAVALGTPADCFSPAYWFLVPSYAALWAGGRWSASLPLPRRALALAVAVTVCFVISNASFYALSGRFAELAWTEYAARVARYLPGYLLTTVVYVGLGWAIAAAVRDRGSQASARRAF